MTPAPIAVHRLGSLLVRLLPAITAVTLLILAGTGMLTGEAG